MMPAVATWPTAQDFGNVDAARISLVDDVGQQKPVRDHGLSGSEGRVDDFFHQLGPRGHVEQHLATRRNGRCVVAFEQDLPHALPQGRAARVAAGDDFVPRRLQPLAEQPHLRGLAHAVDTVKGEKHGSVAAVHNGQCDCCI